MAEQIEPKQEGKRNVRAICNTCSAVSIFILDSSYKYSEGTSDHYWALLKCSNCSEGGLAHFEDNFIRKPRETTLISFIPKGKYKTTLPANVPDNIKNEFEEAEKCFSASANRGASALIRSVLEKTLKENGYTTGSLKKKIDEASDDGVITASRKEKAHGRIRVIGNEIVHDEWRVVDNAEVSAGLHYAQRVLEDFYDDRPSVEAILKTKKRLPLPHTKKTL